MRQGDGSDVLGPGDPRNADIGILYVESKDSRQTVLTALNTQEVQGRKQIAIVLPEQGKAFRHSLDFDGLKAIRRQIKAQVIFIVPSGRGPAEMARQRRFTVYSSLDTFRSALLNEGISTTKQRGKSRSGSVKRPGILDFGERKAHKSGVPCTPKFIQTAPPTPRLHNQAAPPTPRLRNQAAPSTPRLHDQPTPLIMPRVAPTPYLQESLPPEQTGAPGMPPTPPTPRALDQARTRDEVPCSSQSEERRLNQTDKGNVPPTPYLSDQETHPGIPAAPPTPQLDDQWDIPTPRIHEKQAAEKAAMESIPATPDNTPRIKQNAPAASDLFADERMAAAATGILAAGNLENDDDALYTLPASQQVGLPDQTSSTSDDMAKRDARRELPLEDQPTPRKIPLEDRPTPRLMALSEKAAMPKITDNNEPGPGEANTYKDSQLPAAVDPASGVTNQRGSGVFPAIPGPLPPAPNQFGTHAGNTGQFKVFGAPGPGSFRRANARAGSPPAQPLQRGAPFASSSATHPSGTQTPSTQWVVSRFGGSSTNPRPSGLTPLPPPYSRRARRKRNRTLLLLTLLFLLCAFTIMGVFAQRGQGPGLPGSLSATITLTPESKLETDNYLLSALPTGTPDPAHLQIAARLLTQNSGSSTTTAHATGSVTAKAATGKLVFFNSTSSSITLGSTTFTGKDGVQVRVDGPIVVPASGSASASSPAYALKPGSQGNIPAFDIGGPCCANGISVKNTAPFSGGQDAQQNSVLQQSDFDNAARPLISKLTQSTGSALQKQVKSGERAVENTFQCKPTITSDHKVGDTAKTASVQVVMDCTEEVYNFAAAQQIAISRLQARAHNDPALNAHYVLDGQIVTTVLSNTVVSRAGQATIEMQAKGLWVYQITNQMRESVKQALPGLSQADAQRLLTHTSGVASAHINISAGSSLPSSPNAITLVVQSLSGPQATPASASNGSGSPTVIPSGTGIPAAPALTPTLTAVPGLG